MTRRAVASHRGQEDFEKCYRLALRGYMESGSEDDLSLAYALTRMAVEASLPLTTAYEIHVAAVREIARQAGDAPAETERPEQFLMDVLSVYDMAIDGYSQSVRRLSCEIDERKNVEAELRDVTWELARQRDQLDQQVRERTVELKRRLTDLRLANEQLTQTNREQAEFTYALSHDLKSPTNTIRMLLDMMREECGETLGSDAEEFLMAARLTAGRMGRIVDDVLTYSRAIGTETGPDQVDLARLSREVVADLRGDITAADARISIDPLPEVTGNELQLRLLLQNLFSNAIKFRHPDRSPDIRVGGRNSGPGGDAAIWVSDNGIGIDPAHHERIFGMFQRLHGHDVYPGTGLGLTLCKRIVGNHDGRIELRSEPGVGTTFVIRLWSEGHRTGVAA